MNEEVIEEESDDDEFQLVERKNKTKIKRDIKALHVIVKDLIQLPLGKLKKLPLDEDSLAEIILAKDLKREALRRKKMRLVKLLALLDVDAIKHALVVLHQPEREAVDAMHQLEQWRDALIEGDKALLEQLITRFEGIDRQYLRQLIANAKKERERNKPPKSSRLIYRYLSELQPTQA